MPIERVAETLVRSLADCRQQLQSAREKLFAAREPRIHPGRDEKILTSWNALMIEGMAHAGRVFGEPAWIASAQRALDFVRSTMWQEGRLNATHKDGKTHLNAYLDDYAYLLKALIEMLQADFRAEDLAFAAQLADVLLAQFADTERGGFYFTSHDHETLIQRPKPGFDNATPSGNGVAAFALQRLHHLTGDTQYQHASDATLAHFFPAIEDHPSGHGSLLMALEESLAPPRLLIVAGPAEQLPPWQQMAIAGYWPELMTLAMANGAGPSAGLLTRPPQTIVNAWLCEGVVCLPPTANMTELQAELNQPVRSLARTKL